MTDPTTVEGIVVVGRDARRAARAPMAAAGAAAWLTVRARNRNRFRKTPVRAAASLFPSTPARRQRRVWSGMRMRRPQRLYLGFMIKLQI